MKIAKKIFVIGFAFVLAALVSCATTKVKVVELENKGTSMGISTPDWIKLYTANGITKVQALPQYKDKYCIIGEESGINKQFVLAWADNFSAQQRCPSTKTNTASSARKAALTNNLYSRGRITSARNSASALCCAPQS